MKQLEFDALLTFLTLKGKIRHHNSPLGIKKLASGQIGHTRKLYIHSNDNDAIVVYMEIKNKDDTETEGYEIVYAEIEHHGISKIYFKSEVLSALQSF